ncbi:MAG TPA: O-antigen ligase family protein [bacterium]|nr:O-antigen ligase family protein [bacterium]
MDEFRQDGFSWRLARGLAILTAVAVPLFISPISYDSYLLPKRILFQILTLALTSVWIAGSRRIFTPIRDPLWWPIGLFLAWSAFTILTGFHSFRQMRDFAGPITAVLFWAICRQLWTRRENRSALVAWLHLPALMIALYAVLQDYGLDFIQTTGGVNDWRARIVSTMGNPNFVAGYLVILFPALIARGCGAGVSRWWFGLVTIPVVGLCVAVFVTTFCVGAALALVLATSFALFFRTVRRGLRDLLGVRLYVLFFLAAGVVTFYCADNPYNGREGSVLDQAKASPQWRTGFAARRFNWRTTRLMINEHPFLGIGFANFQAHSMTYQGRNYELQARAHPSPYVKLVDQPHHQLLETCAESGIPGIFLLLWLLVSVIKKSLQTLRLADRENRALLTAVFLGFMMAVFHALASFPFHLPASTLAVLIWLSVLLPATEKSPSPQLSPGGRGRRAFHPAYGVCLCLVLMVPLVLPFLSNVYLRQAFEARRYGMIDLEKFRRAVVLDPLEPMNFIYLGEAYSSANLLKEAAEVYLAALRLQDDFSSHLALRDICGQLGAVEAMIEQQRQVIRLNPGYIPYWEELEEMCRKHGMEAEAENARRRIEALRQSG